MERAPAASLAPAFSEPPPPPSHGGTELSAGALGLGGVFVQALTHIAPGIGLIFLLPFVSTQAGVTAPLTFLLAFALVLTVVFPLIQLARVFPSAGGYFTYVSNGLSPLAGWLTAWFQFAVELFVPALLLPFLGAFVEDSLATQFDVHVAWWVFVLVGFALLAIAATRGISLAAAILIALGAIEALVFVVLAVFGILDPGAGGVNVEPFDVSGAPSGVFLAVAFTLLAFQGFETTAPLAEETQDPRRTLPRAMLLSIVAVAGLFVFCSWGFLVGWGTDRAAAFGTSAANPVTVLAERYWGAGQLIITLVLVNSVFASLIAAMNAATRTIFGMSRAGALPRALAHLHPVHRTPTRAVMLALAINLPLSIFLGVVLGPIEQYGVLALVVTFSIVLVYCAGNAAVFWRYLRDPELTFRPFLHAVLPALSTVALGWVVYKATVPLPDYPISLAPVIFAGWAVLGVALTLALSRRTDKRWMEAARRVFDGEQLPMTAAAEGSRDDA